MSTFLLCQGGWRGGWYWKRVAGILRAEGHQVLTPSYTGLGERAHLLTPDVGLDTHIDDILGVIRCEELEDFVLVGRSYGGMVVTSVADRVYDKISSLIYLDAALPRDGQSMTDLVGGEADALRARADADGEGWKIPFPTAAERGIEDEADRAWIDRLSGFHPLATLTQPLTIAGNHLKIANKAYILASENDPSPFHQFADWTRAQADWRTAEIACHHMPMISMPAETARLLMELGV
jgi:pimeloyl-ACP methyl ester carboxylesterase